MCMGERIQPGGRVDKETYERFKEFVQSQHGSVRGNLGREMEKAMRDRINAATGPNAITRIEDDVATIKAMIAEGEADGGYAAPTPSEADSTPTREMSKPAPNQPRGRKIEYIISELDLSIDGGSVHPNVLRNTIETEYSFNDETVEDLVDSVVDRLEAIQIGDSDVYYWGKAIEARREKLRDEADAELNSMD